MTQTTGRDPEGLVPTTQSTTDDQPAPSNTRRLRPGLPPAARRLSDRITRQSQHLLTRPWAAEGLVGLICAVVFSWWVARPSPWWDEAVTRDVTSRSVGNILDLSETVDLVHTTYYLIVHALLGTSSTVTPIRVISVAAATVTGVLLVRLGRELGSGRVGLVAGLLWVIGPLATRYAQEARPYAMVAMTATAATLALVRVCRKPWRRRRWAAYVACLVALGLLNLIGLTVLAAHVCYVLATSAGRVQRRWGLAVALALVLLSPMLWFAGQQSGQVSWLPVPTLQRLTAFFEAQYEVTWIVLGLLVLAIAGIARGTHRPALGLGLAWAILPPALLWTISQVHPLYDWRYVFFAVPGSALALASLATLLRARHVVIVLLVLTVGGAHMQNVYRWSATGHAENLRGVAEAVAAGAQPGDAVMFLPSNRRVVKLAYPDDFRAVDDIALAQTGEKSDTLWGVESSIEEITKALNKRTRVWVVTSDTRLGETRNEVEIAKERLLYQNFQVTGIDDVGSYQVELYERSSKDAGIVAAGSASS